MSCGVLDSHIWTKVLLKVFDTNELLVCVTEAKPTIYFQLSNGKSIVSDYFLTYTYMITIKDYLFTEGQFVIV